MCMKKYDQRVFLTQYETTINHSLTLLPKHFEVQFPTVYKMRLKSLMTVCHSALMDSRLFLTSLARRISNTNKESSNIQKVVRLLGNRPLQVKRDVFIRQCCLM